jgi:hypothetical protein
MKVRAKFLSEAESVFFTVNTIRLFESGNSVRTLTTFLKGKENEK